MSLIKLQACEAIRDALAAFIATCDPALAVEVKALDQPPVEAGDYDGIAVVPLGRWKFMWEDEDEVRDSNGEAIVVGPSSDQALMNVGNVTGTIRLWLAARYPINRAKIEDAVISAFNQGASPGVLDVTMPSAVICGIDTGHTPCTYISLRDEAWNEEQAFSEKRWAELDLDVDLPILVLRAGAPIITDIRLVISTDITTDITGAPISPTPDEAIAALQGEVYQIDENGNLTEI